MTGLAIRARKSLRSDHRFATALRASLIVVAGLLLGLLINQVSLRGIPLIPPLPAKPGAGELITLEAAHAEWAGGAVLFLDARDPADFAAGHIGNALNLPAQSFVEHLGEIAPLLSSDSEVIVYCDGLECDLSHRLAGDLRERGYTHVHVLANGWTLWRKAGFPSSFPASR